MAEWNKIPLPVDRPITPEEEPHELKDRILMYTAGLLENWGVVAHASSIGVHRRPYDILELPPIDLESGGSFYIGQLPVVKGRTIVSPASLSVVASCDRRNADFSAAIFPSRDYGDSSEVVVDEGDRPLPYPDLRELTDALRVVWASADQDNTNDVPHNVDGYPRLSGDSRFSYCIQHFVHEPTYRTWV